MSILFLNLLLDISNYNTMIPQHFKSFYARVLDSVPSKIYTNF